MIELYQAGSHNVVLGTIAEVEKLLVSKRAMPWMNTSDGRERYDKWYKTKSLAHALKLAAYGWLDGLELIQSTVNQITNQVTQLTEAEDYQYNPVEGIAIDMGRYTSGQPDCWLAVEPMPVSVRGNRVLRLGFNTVMASGTDPQSIAQYGGMVAGSIAALEMQGYRCELWAIGVFANHEDREISSLGFQVKAAYEDVNLARVAFAVANPSASRRIAFGMLERVPTARKYGGSYGKVYNGSEAPESLTNALELDVYFSTVNNYAGWDRKWSEAAAVKAATEILRQYQ